MTQTLCFLISMATPLLSLGARVTHSGELIRAFVTSAKLPLGVFEDDTMCMCVVWVCVLLWAFLCLCVLVYIRVCVCVGECVSENASEGVCENKQMKSDAVGEQCVFSSILMFSLTSVENKISEGVEGWGGVNKEYRSQPQRVCKGRPLSNIGWEKRSDQEKSSDKTNWDSDK